jgi:hypothetical protein
MIVSDGHESLANGWNHVESVTAAGSHINVRRRSKSLHEGKRGRVLCLHGQARCEIVDVKLWQVLVTRSTFKFDNCQSRDPAANLKPQASSSTQYNHC